MNKAMLRESVGQIIRIEPKPRHHEAEVDPDWRVTNADSKGIEITHLGNQQRVRIAFDQIHEYVSPVEGDQRGCLYLYGRIFVGDPHPKLASLSPAERRALYGGRSRAQTAPDLRRSMNLLIAEIGRNKLLRGRMAGWPEHKHLDLMIDRLEKVHGDEEPLATLYTLRQRTQGQRALNEYPQSVGHQHQAHYVPAADDALIALRLFLQRAKPDGFQVGLTRREIDDTRRAERLRRVEAAEQKSSLLKELYAFRDEGTKLRDKIARTPAPPFVPPTGSIAPATVPIDNEDGQDVTRWRESVASLLWSDHKRLAEHFTGCRPSGLPLERVNCHLERLERVLDEIRDESLPI